MTREEKIIDELCRLLSDYERNQPREEAQKERYRWAVKEVTKALQEQKVGKWIRGGYWSEGCGMGETYGYYYKCSECGSDVKGGYTECGCGYCSECGATMKGVEYETDN